MDDIYVLLQQIYRNLTLRGLKKHQQPEPKSHVKEKYKT